MQPFKSVTSGKWVERLLASRGVRGGPMATLMQNIHNCYCVMGVSEEPHAPY